MRSFASGFLALFTALALSPAHARLALSSRYSQCEPFQTSFAPGVVSASPGTPFLALSPPGSYSTDAHDLQLYLTKPSGTVTTTDGVNNVVGEGATVNSTFTFLYGRVTYTLAAPVVPGVVTAAILIGTLLSFPPACSFEIDEQRRSGRGRRGRCRAPRRRPRALADERVRTEPARQRPALGRLRRHRGLPDGQRRAEPRVHRRLERRAHRVERGRPGSPHRHQGCVAVPGAPK